MYTEHEIPTQNVARVCAKLEELNKRARKLELPEMQMQEEDLGMRDAPFGVSGRPLSVPFTRVTIAGEPPQLNGWSFMATLSFFGDATVVKTVPGVDVPDSYRAAAPTCDHCGYTRNRKDAFVLRHVDGEYKQVGRNCLKDFLGYTDPRAYAGHSIAVMEFRDELDEAESLPGSATPTLFALKDYLAWVVLAIRNVGWVSRTEARDLPNAESTAYVALTAMRYYGNADKWTKDWDAKYPTDADKERADEVLQWAQAFDPSNDYEHNISAIAKSGVMDVERTLGLAGSMIRAYDRATGCVEERKHRQESEWIGEEGERLEFVLTYITCHSFENQWGWTDICKLVDEDGNYFTWFASTAPDFEAGNKYLIRGTIKKHEQYRGRKETHITRCKILEDLPAS